MADEILQAAVERKLSILGEAFAQLRAEDPATAERFSELRKIIGMRNRLVHGYDQLDLDVLWDATISKVPLLLKEVETLLKKFNEPPGNKIAAHIRQLGYEPVWKDWDAALTA